MSAADKYYSDEILGSYDKSFAELEKIEQELENPKYLWTNCRSLRIEACL
ncbi:MAG: hypothetical protein IJ894_06890 [Bacteroidales bacterium]|nr:hypothetical protein [Bacteroidales bacterium]